MSVSHTVYKLLLWRMMSRIKGEWIYKLMIELMFEMIASTAGCEGLCRLNLSLLTLDMLF